MRSLLKTYVPSVLLTLTLLGAGCDRGDAEQEIVMLKKALAAKPDFGRAWANLGVAHASGGDLDAAEEPFRNAAMYEPSAKNWINLAKLHHAKGRTELAQEAAGKARALGGL